ncbi:erythromycin esterase family protein [Qaidamihabitans albus]|uniref:erythromycin esterase family protein n=1 Tax=Qaidamihabitans albus TaxID=2795733 RepID=UPI0018F175F6|nr:erythromycin esterase family protein [Qaidamihabitans albus]
MPNAARSRRLSQWQSLFVAAVSVCLPLVSVATPATAADHHSKAPCEPIESWIDRHAHAIEIAPGAPARDLRWLDRVIRDARLVGLGESTHGSSEQLQVKHRLVRRMIEHHGFRTVAFEDDFASGVLIDRYLTTGQGDPRTLVGQMASPLLATEEILELVTWLRAWNESHSDKVRFLGTDLLQLRELSFDHITRYVSTRAPDRIGELEADLADLRPPEGQNPFVWYGGLDDAEKLALIAAAGRVVTLVEDVAGPDRWEREYAEQHARAILGWFRNYYVESGFRAHRERFIADSLRWWQGLTGHRKAVYWAANVHTAATPTVTVRTPEEEQSGTLAGGILKRRLGERYVSIGTWFGAGEISSPGRRPMPQPIGPPGAGMFEATLHAARPANFAIDLRAPRGPAAVLDWLDDVHTMRVILPVFEAGHDGNDYTMTVDGLRAAFDAAIYLPVTTASRTY